MLYTNARHLSRSVWLMRQSADSSQRLVNEYERTNKHRYNRYYVFGMSLFWL